MAWQENFPREGKSGGCAAIDTPSSFILPLFWNFFLFRCFAFTADNSHSSALHPCITLQTA
ncbi:MAG: hypothetical protein IKW44_03105, partial [Bacteroidaceae bacterium]|nr:hypothetical protein [Bacteroidaceae bacterium]